jgi:RecA-family ATPase
MTPLDLRHLARALGGDVSNGSVLAPGPGHSAADRSLSVKMDANAPDGFLVHSFAGDDPIQCRDYVRTKCGLPEFKPNGKRPRASSNEIAALFASAMQHQRRDDKPRGQHVATFDYTDESGVLLYQVLKYEDPKTFRQRRPDGNGGWVWKLDGRRVLYRLPELLQFPDATIFVCEGEKDADRVTSLGHCATTVASGVWRGVNVEPLHGRDIIILQDNDTAGARRALEAARQLHAKAKTLRVVLLPNLGEGEDVSDWLDADPRRAEKLIDVCFDAPEWAPEKDQQEASSCPPSSSPPSPSSSSPASSPPSQPSPSRGDDPKPKLPPLPFIDMSKWDEEPVPEQEWAVPNRIPLRQVVLFSGEGAAGKSTIQLHQFAAGVLGCDWLGTMPMEGPAIYVDAEDDKDVIHRRLAAIADHYNVKFADLINGGLHLVSLVGHDAVLATASRSGKVEPTARYKQLLEAAGDIKPRMIGIASSADVFAGDENNRQQVQQFVGLLTRIAIVADGSLSLISHPSLTGVNTDTGLSGTTQWHNSVRARSYLKGVKPESGEQPDGDLRELVFKKNNYGPISESIVLKYTNGLFLPVSGQTSLDKAAHEAKAMDVFLSLLGRFDAQNRVVSDKPNANNYAPTVFAAETGARTTGVRKAALADAMRALFEKDKIHLASYGSPSKGTQKLVVGRKPEE